MTIEPWWVVHGDNLMAALKRVEAGESPDMVYAEMFANSEHDEGED